MVEELIERLKVYIKDSGLTIYKLTILADLSENTIYNWFNKGAEPTISALESICKILKISMAELFYDGKDDIMSYKERVLLSKFKTLSNKQKDLLLKLTEELKT